MRPSVLASLIYCGAAFGGAFLFMRLAAPELPALVVAFGRVGIASILLLPFVGRAGWPRCAPRGVITSSSAGGSMPQTEEEQKQVMTAWTDWFGSLGAALKDPGNPASRTKTLGPDGSVADDPTGPSGYSIISADSIDEAVDIARGCPVLAGGASIQVVETFEVM